MNNYDNLYCKIFIDTDKEKDAITDLISIFMSGKIEMSSISTEYMDICVRRNEDFDEIKRVEKQDGFLYSRYFLDVEPKSYDEQDAYISNVAKLLEKLWSAEFIVVAACDFENELPRKGGYNY